MSLIKNLKSYPSKTPTKKEALVMCGFGGSVWQTRRLITVLRRNGYNVTALDFPKETLSKGDAKLLPQLIDEVMDFAGAKARELNKPILLVGISLGSLVALNILRRSSLFTEGILITGGDIVTVAHNIYGRKVWPQSHEELAKEWQHINMYTKPEKLKGKRLLFVLPAKDRLIDTQDVHREVRVQNDAGNHLMLVIRHSFGHVGTIIEETILFPKRTLSYIEQVKD
jgi:pimeloyl-ACP methyl ester carboxylesterase